MNYIKPLLALCLFCIAGFSPIVSQAADRPNVVWIVSEDNSIHYQDMFFKGGAKTPNIEAMAKNGLLYRHAFSNSPVCSVARTTLATGCYGPRIGTQYHRRYKLSQLTGGLRMFTSYLKDAGYYTSNNSKTDYNATPSKDVWHESSNKATWRKRPDASQPFFHMESWKETHESSLHFRQNDFANKPTSHDPSKIKVADYFPDTKLFRYTHARYLDNIQKIDNIVGNTIGKLKEDGVLEDTFVFYFGDHGGVLPRGKGYIYESGLHVPLVVRVPENFKHLVDVERGSEVTGFVSFIDFGPTVLNLAGVKTPSQMDGVPFLGDGIKTADVNQRDEAFGYADRFDEKYDFKRSLRKGRFHYIRSYQPYLPDGLQNNYRYRMLAYEEWRTLYKADKLNAAQRQFFEPRPVELLFDVEADPHEIHNLSASPEHQATLKDLRGRLQQRMRAMPDLSFFPESHLVNHALDNAVKFGRTNKTAITAMAETADLSLLPFAQAKDKIATALAAKVPMQRYWGCMVCSAFGKQAAEFTETVTKLANDDTSEVVRIRAAEFIGLIGAADPQKTLVTVINQTTDPVVAMEALNSVVLFHDFTDYKVDPKSLKPTAKGDGVTRRIDYINGEPYRSKPRNGRPKKKNRKAA